MTPFKQVAQDTDVTASTEIVLRQYSALTNFVTHSRERAALRIRRRQ
jgi:hypothetical protein